MKKEVSGLATQTIELAMEERRLGHGVCIKQPQDEMPLWGNEPAQGPDVQCVHSQYPMTQYHRFHDGKPTFLWCHGEPLSSVGNGVSMKALIDLADTCDAFIAMRREEVGIWSRLKRTYLVQKGIDLTKYKPIEGYTEKLQGEPAILYIENWRGQRNPLYLLLAMQKVHQKYPKARLHLYNCTDQKMKDTFSAMINHAKFWTFVKSLQGPVTNVNELYNKVDIVVSCLFPLYARGIEAFGAGKAFIGPGYREYDDYPFTCDLDPDSMANAIIKCIENYDTVDYRKWASERHNIQNTVKQSMEVYARYQ
jgi:glycosyltransferase involved in cell wall biosynthesis